MTDTSVQTPQQLPSLLVKTTLGDMDLASRNGRGLVLYFYPKDDTSGCTVEGQDFTAHQQAFAQAGYDILGVSRDTLNSHKKFIDKYGFSFGLISDAEEALCSAFGVIKLKTMYGKPARGIDRSTFLYSADGALLQEWRGVKVPGHVQAVLEAAQAKPQA